MGIYYSCALEDFDTTTGVCSNPVWVDASPGLLPPLSVEDGIQISTAIITVWTIAFCFKLLRKFIFK